MNHSNSMWNLLAQIVDMASAENNADQQIADSIISKHPQDENRQLLGDALSGSQSA